MKKTHVVLIAAPTGIAGACCALVALGRVIQRSEDRLAVERAWRARRSVGVAAAS